MSQARAGTHLRVELAMLPALINAKLLASTLQHLCVKLGAQNVAKHILHWVEAWPSILCGCSTAVAGLLPCQSSRVCTDPPRSCC